jgi:hypothetical protein
MIREKSIGPSSFVLYGNNYAIVLKEGHSAFRFIVIKSLAMTRSFSEHFLSLWDNSQPFMTAVTAKQLRITT